MTTQHMYHEHDDVENSVVGTSSVPENTADSIALEATIPEETPTIQEASSSEELSTPSTTQAEMGHESLVAPSEEQYAIPSLTSFPTERDTISTQERPDEVAQQTPQATTEPEVASAEPVLQAFEAPQSDFTIVYNEAMPLVEPDEEEVRPFTAFIEEFRLAEEQARVTSPLQEASSQPFALFPSTEEQAEAAASTFTVEESVVQEPSSPADRVQEEVEQREEQPESEPSAPVERAVSPLLRPPARLRSSRHSRHQREEQAIAAAQAAPVGAPFTSPPEEAVPPTTQTVETAIQQTEAQAQPEQAQPAEQQPARPARRYRFDRPAAGTTNSGAHTTQAPAPAAPLHAEEKETQNRAASSARAEAAPATNEGTTETPVKSGQSTPQEPAAPEQASAAAESGRRRHGHERQKEQAVPAASTTTAAPPAVEPPAPAREATTPSGEVAPEDLPPLEYAELQKSSRKRRRHRSGTGNGTTAPAAAETPATPPPAPAAPVGAQFASPATPAPGSATTNGAPYSIISGYTVSQMNQGNDTTGPFMGPEPSPARGSIMGRESRPSRAEAQRGSATPSIYPLRTHESASSSSISHFANMVVQALQTQTDRMVAELRHANQAPTSVSVSLPPFPSTERVGVFVDVANLLYSARTMRISVDFGKLLDFLRGNRRLVRAHAYCPTSPQAGDEQMFLQAVKGLGYRITTKNYKTFSSGAKKADLDLDLCMDVVRLVDGRAVDCIVLVSGDSDFMPMLDYCSDHGVRVEVAAFDEAMSATLRQSCDLFINLSMLEEIRS